MIAYREKPDVRDVVAAMHLGAHDYLEWPFQGQALEYRLRTALRLRRWGAGRRCA